MTRAEPPRTGSDLLVLYALRCGGDADTVRVAAVVGLDDFAVESELIDLAVAGFITRLAGEFGAWGLTDAGRVAVAERITDELESAAARTSLTGDPAGASGPGRRSHGRSPSTSLW